MNRIDDLIAKYCPNGVEFHDLADVFEMRNGYTPSRRVSEFWTDGTVPWFRMDDIRENGRILHDSLERVSTSAVKGDLFPADSLIIATSATIGEHALVRVPFLANQRFTVLWLKDAFKGVLDMEFAFYYGFVLDEWCRANTTTSSFPSVHMAGFRRFKLPAPPLEVQREIVRILDKFTQLEAELEAELEARKKQYSYYVDSIYDQFDQSLQMVPLGDVILHLRTGLNPRTNFVLNSPGAENYYVTVRELDGTSVTLLKETDRIDEDALRVINRRSRLRVGDVLFSGTGTIGRTALISTPPGNWNIKEGVYALTPNVEVLLPEYLLRVLQKQNVVTQFAAAAMGSTVRSVSMAQLKRIKIPLYPLDIQAVLAEKLNVFDALVNDLSSGLPAEILARRKQYEYYRDRLLTFKELAA